MLNGKPPSARPQTPGGEQLLDTARGELRDAIGGLHNLSQLLRSVRTGPRALTSVLPDVHASCASLRQALVMLLEAVRTQLPAHSTAADELQEFANPRLQELERSLAEARGRPLNAKCRLALEQVVAGCTSDLEATRELIQLLDSAISEPRVRLDLLELTRETLVAKPRVSDPPGAAISATLSCRDAGVELFVNARVAMALLSIGVQLIANSGAQGCDPNVTVRRTASGDCSISVAATSPEGEPIVLRSRRIVPPTLACARAMAELTEGVVQYTADPVSFELIWPAAAGRG
jgi:hypothetical protein